MLRRILSLIWTVVLISQVCSQVSAQTTPNPLQDEVDEAEARAKIAKAKKEELENKFPTPDANALKATNTVEGTPIESTIQGYNSFRKISTKIATESQVKGVQGLYVYREADYKKIIEYKNLIQQLDVINGEYAKCFQGRVGVAAIPVGVLASVFLKWLPILKTDTQIKVYAVTIEDEAVWAILGDSLSQKGITLHNPFITPFDFINLAGVPAPILVSKLELAERDLTSGPCTRVPAYNFKPQIDAAFTNLKKDLGLIISVPTPTKKVTTTTTTDTPPTKKVEETIENTPAGSPGEIKFWDYARTEKIISSMGANGIYWLVIKNVKAGGNMRIKSNPLVDIFRGGSSVKFSGGSVAYYYILDNTGNIVVSNVINGYIPYEKSSKIK